MSLGVRTGIILLSSAALAAWAGPAGAQSNAELLRIIEQLQRRVDQLEAQQRAAPRQPAAPAPQSSATPPLAAPARRAAPPAVAIAAPVPPAAVPQTPQERRAEIRAAVDESLRGDLPDSFRIPGTDTSIRLYGFIKANLYGDLNMVNRTDAPTIQATPLAGSAADLQSGDVQFSARRSRIGFESSTPAGDWGRFLARLEMDFAGSNPSPSSLATSNSFQPRLRLAYVSLGGDIASMLVGQADSLWNQSPIETLTDATFLSGSGVRQAQVRLTGRLMPGLIGAVSLETPYTDYTQNGSVQYPDASLNGGASPATTGVPDLLGRLIYAGDWGNVTATGLLRNLTVDTNGVTNPSSGAPYPVGTASTIGWGARLGTTINMRAVSDAFGADQFILLGYYGQGIGRYFDATSNGQSAFSDLGLPGVRSVSLTPTPMYGGFVGYRRFWSPEFRTNLGAAYAAILNPGFTDQFTPGNATTQTLNSNMQMYVANLIWSPFATERNGRLDPGRLDVGLEYQYYRRNAEGGAAAMNARGADGLGGYGIEQRIQATMIGRF